MNEVLPKSVSELIAKSTFLGYFLLIPFNHSQEQILSQFILKFVFVTIVSQSMHNTLFINPFYVILYVIRYFPRLIVPPEYLLV